jgi:hypothetical protein
MKSHEEPLTDRFNRVLGDLEGIVLVADALKLTIDQSESKSNMHLVAKTMRELGFQQKRRLPLGSKVKQLVYKRGRGNRYIYIYRDPLTDEVHAGHELPSERAAKPRRTIYYDGGSET